MEIVELINHPERLDRDTLYELRSVLALYPYFQTARLLMLQNLFLLHDPSFDEELRRAAIYITDRKVIFQMIEAGHYKLPTPQKKGVAGKAADKEERESRTLSLIDTFLESIPKEEEEAADKQPKRKCESDEERRERDEVPQLIGHSLIDSFIENDKGKIVLNDNPTLKPEMEEAAGGEEKEQEENYLTETLARIYIKQGRYSKALEIIRRLSLQYPKKNAYFADQIRFLEKLIINSNNK